MLDLSLSSYIYIHYISRSLMDLWVCSEVLLSLAVAAAAAVVRLDATTSFLQLQPAALQQKGYTSAGKTCGSTHPSPMLACSYQLIILLILFSFMNHNADINAHIYIVTHLSL